MRRSESVVLDENFLAWLDEQEPEVRVEVLAHARLLAAEGPGLARPYAAVLDDAGYAGMRELRLQVGGKPWRILFAVDPDGTAVLLDGGGKSGDPRWYRRHLTEAGRRYERHLARRRRRAGG
jgi:hypothetical protein